jgi:hypothetical protein
VLLDAKLTQLVVRLARASDLPTFHLLQLAALVLVVALSAQFNSVVLFAGSGDLPLSFKIWARHLAQIALLKCGGPVIHLISHKGGGGGRR